MPLKIYDTAQNTGNPELSELINILNQLILNEEANIDWNSIIKQQADLEKQKVNQAEINSLIENLVKMFKTVTVNYDNELNELTDSEGIKIRFEDNGNKDADRNVSLEDLQKVKKYLESNNPNDKYQYTTEDTPKEIVISINNGDKLEFEEKINKIKVVSEGVIKDKENQKKIKGKVTEIENLFPKSITISGVPYGITYETEINVELDDLNKLAGFLQGNQQIIKPEEPKKIYNNKPKISGFTFNDDNNIKIDINTLANSTDNVKEFFNSLDKSPEEILKIEIENFKKNVKVTEENVNKLKSFVDDNGVDKCIPLNGESLSDLDDNTLIYFLYRNNESGENIDAILTEMCKKLKLSNEEKNADLANSKVKIMQHINSQTDSIINKLDEYAGKCLNTDDMNALNYIKKFYLKEYLCITTLNNLRNKSLVNDEPEETEKKLNKNIDNFEADYKEFKGITIDLVDVFFKEKNVVNNSEFEKYYNILTTGISDKIKKDIDDLEKNLNEIRTKIDSLFGPGKKYNGKKNRLEQMFTFLTLSLNGLAGCFVKIWDKSEKKTDELDKFITSYSSTIEGVTPRRGPDNDKLKKENTIKLVFNDEANCNNKDSKLKAYKDTIFGPYKGVFDKKENFQNDTYGWNNGSYNNFDTFNFLKDQYRLFEEIGFLTKGYYKDGNETNKDPDNIIFEEPKNKDFRLFAFGFSGSGKTYTLITGESKDGNKKGIPRDPSVMAHLLKYLITNGNKANETKIIDELYKVNTNVGFYDLQVSIFYPLEHLKKTKFNLNKEIKKGGGNATKDIINFAETYESHYIEKFKFLKTESNKNPVNILKNISGDNIEKQVVNGITYLTTVVEDYMKQNLYIVPTTNNPNSSRAFTVYKIQTKDGGKGGNIYFTDMPGNEKTSLIKKDYLFNDEFIKTLKEQYDVDDKFPSVRQTTISAMLSNMEYFNKGVQTEKDIIIHARRDKLITNELLTTRKNKSTIVNVAQTDFDNIEFVRTTGVKTGPKGTIKDIDQLEQNFKHLCKYTFARDIFYQNSKCINKLYPLIYKELIIMINGIPTTIVNGKKVLNFDDFKKQFGDIPTKENLAKKKAKIITPNMNMLVSFVNQFNNSLITVLKKDEDDKEEDLFKINGTADLLKEKKVDDLMKVFYKVFDQELDSTTINVTEKGATKTKTKTKTKTIKNFLFRKNEEIKPERIAKGSADNSASEGTFVKFINKFRDYLEETDISEIILYEINLTTKNTGKETFGLHIDKTKAIINSTNLNYYASPIIYLYIMLASFVETDEGFATLFTNPKNVLRDNSELIDEYYCKSDINPGSLFFKFYFAFKVIDYICKQGDGINTALENHKFIFLKKSNFFNNCPDYDENKPAAEKKKIFKKYDYTPGAGDGNDPYILEGPGEGCNDPSSDKGNVIFNDKANVLVRNKVMSGDITINLNEYIHRKYAPNMNKALYNEDPESNDVQQKFITLIAILRAIDNKTQKSRCAFAIDSLKFAQQISGLEPVEPNKAGASGGALYLQNSKNLNKYNKVKRKTQKRKTSYSSKASSKRLIYRI